MISKHFPFFIAAAEEGNFHRAAERMNIAQSALSRHISTLERELGGVRLFERLTRGVQLTEAGRVFLDDVRRIIANTDEAAVRAQRIERGQTGLLRIAFTEAAVATPLLADGLTRFKAAFAEIQPHLFSMVSQVQREKLRSEEVDVGFMYREEGDERDFESLPLFTDRFLLAIPKGHALLARRTITMQDLASEPLIFPSRHTAPTLFDRMIARFQSKNISPAIITEVPSTDIINCLVAAKIGIGFLITSQKERVPDAVVLREIEDLDVSLPLVLAWLRHNRSPIVRNFVDTIESVVPRSADLVAVAHHR